MQVQIITLEPEVDIEEIDRVKGELRGYTERVNNGETSFSTLALLYSEDQVSARRGGELDFLSFQKYGLIFQLFILIKLIILSLLIYYTSNKSNSILIDFKIMILFIKYQFIKINININHSHFNQIIIS